MAHSVGTFLLCTICRCRSHLVYSGGEFHETRQVSELTMCHQSPRWLILKDRPEEAMAVLRELRAGKFTDADIEAEFAMILHKIQESQDQGTFLDIFQGTHRRRTGIVVGANFFLQATGQLFTALYGALFVKSLGTINPFTVTVIIALVNVCTAFLAMTLFDRLGRRCVFHTLWSHLD